MQPTNATPRIEFDREHRLAICRPEGRFDAAVTEWLLIYLMALEDSEPRPFSRLLDLTRLVEIRLSGSEVCDIAQARLMATAKLPPFRTAILAISPFAYAIARLYEDLMKGSSIAVGVFRDAASAAQWLCVPVSIVTAQIGV
jgi:hypothetical protein